ncbi:E3 ubiquitin-protein ligase XIAP-like isoform X1 [Dreissena polymorpha]|uniref:E3 ubiquitin-protein ligase XIAP-like isoform X1 n=1 Tax=Dreissena polymorpha TaxID=45954 RepID=UPI0022641484|nr:E3 ubiquitin-protein ligase XIAP-like isoform X1 [Dreissena polymorpha]
MEDCSITSSNSTASHESESYQNSLQHTPSLNTLDLDELEQDCQLQQHRQVSHNPQQVSLFKERNQEATFRHVPIGVNAATIDPPLRAPSEDYAPNPQDFYSQYFNERERLSTFHDWPEGANVTKEDLAKNGFIYLHVSDRVQCVFCRACLGEWSQGDIVANEHRKYCPECPLAFGYECGNIPLPASSRPQSTQQSQQRSYNTSITTVKIPVLAPTVAAGQFARVTHPNPTDAHAYPASGQRQAFDERQIFRSALQPPRTAETSSLGSAVVITEPKHPDWEDQNTRLRSFNGWPAQMSQTPRDLSAAGLLYMGKGDYCTCFWCGGQLYDWEPNDVPWVEHAKWFPQCGFVRQQKGEAFIQRVRNQETVGVESPSNQEFLRRPHVLAALNDYGYTQELVLEALQTCGAQSLVTAQNIRRCVEELKNKRQAAQAQARLAEDTPYTVRGQHNQPQDDRANRSDHLSNRSDSMAVITSRGQQVTHPSDDSEDVEMMDIELSSRDIPTIRQLQNLNINRPSSAASTSSADVETVLQENEKLKEQRVCKICMDKDVCITFMPCRHLATCEDCAGTLHTCPICRKPVEDRVRVYWS